MAIVKKALVQGSSVYHEFMSENSERLADEQQSLAYQFLGMFTAVFSETEYVLHLVLSYLVDPARRSKGAAISEGMRFRDLTSTLRRLHDGGFVPDGLPHDLPTLLSELDSLNNDRNELLHSRVMYDKENRETSVAAIRRRVRDTGYSETLTADRMNEFLERATGLEARLIDIAEYLSQQKAE